MKQIIAVHDLSGFGRCSLSVVLPTLAALGVRGLPLPTALLSAHTAFPQTGKEVFIDLTDELEPILDHWEALKVPVDGFYSGFLGSERQMDILTRRLDKLVHPGFLTMVDPVMGDNGRPYRTYTPEMCRSMSKFAEKADVITPNLTEAALLLGEGYDPAPGVEKVERWVERLALEGRRSVVLTGVSGGEGVLGAASLDRETGQFHLSQAPLVPGRFSGTGDLFASVVFGRLLSGWSLRDAADSAADFVSRAAQAALDAGCDPLEGAWFEPLLGRLA